MLILLPLLTFLLLSLTLLGTQSRTQNTNPSLRTTCIQTAVLMVSYIILSSEALSLFKSLTQTWVSISWFVALVAVAWYGIRSRAIQEGLGVLRGKWHLPERSDFFPGFLLFLILSLLLVIALVSPSNNNDSLRYHLARVVNWAQNQSLGHYPTAYVPQVMHPIGAEVVLLNLRLLWGNDALANLVQYGSLLGVLLGVSAIAKLLGANKYGQWLAAAFAVSLPVGILEATSTQTDYVTAFWLVSLLFFILQALRHSPTRLEIICVGLALGLGIATKPSFSFYILIPIAWFGVMQMKNTRIFQAILEFIVISCLVLLLNAGYWTRNYITFGSIFGQDEFISTHINTIRGPGRIVARALQITVQNFATPDELLNEKLMDWVNSVSTTVDPGGYPFSFEWGWNHEDLAGNPIHFTLFFLTWIVLLLLRKRISDKQVYVYSGILTGSLLVMATMVRNDLYGVRHQLPFLVAWAPVFGVTVEAIRKKWLSYAMVILLLLIAFPWVIFNRTRPLIAMRDSPDPLSIPCLAGCTNPSILFNPPSYSIFGSINEYRDDYLRVTDELKSSGCREIGLKLDSHDPEYILWWLLDAPQSGIRLESLWTYPELQRYRDASFEPCAIVCATCSRDTENGLNLFDKNGYARLYVGGNYSAEP